MIVAIHQPEHLPWLGFLDKARQCDVFVLLDSVQYRKRYFQNRNRVRGPAGTLFATVPVLSRGKYSQLIRDVEIDNGGNPRWREKWIKTLEACYARAPFWSEHRTALENFSRREWSGLADFNESLIRYIFWAFGFSPKIVRASFLGAEGQKGNLILDICQRLSSEVYLSGISGRAYLDAEAFRKAGIGLRFQEFHHPIYSQGDMPFEPTLSSIDLLAHHGPRAGAILAGDGVETMQDVFL